MKASIFAVIAILSIAPALAQQPCPPLESPNAWTERTKDQIGKNVSASGDSPLEWISAYLDAGNGKPMLFGWFVRNNTEQAQGYSWRDQYGRAKLRNPHLESKKHDQIYLEFQGGRPRSVAGHFEYGLQGEPQETRYWEGDPNDKAPSIAAHILLWLGLDRGGKPADVAMCSTVRENGGKKDFALQLENVSQKQEVSIDLALGREHLIDILNKTGGIERLRFQEGTRIVQKRSANQQFPYVYPAAFQQRRDKHDDDDDDTWRERAVSPDEAIKILKKLKPGHVLTIWFSSKKDVTVTQTQLSVSADGKRPAGADIPALLPQ